MGRVQEGVRRKTESRARGEGTREERLFDMSVSERGNLITPSEERRERWMGGSRRGRMVFHNDAMSVCFSQSAGFGL